MTAIMCVACGNTRQPDEPPCTCRVRTPQPWQAGTRPTAAQLLEWLRTATDDEALTAADALLRSSDVAHRCLVMDHDHAMRELTAAQLDRARWAVIRDEVRAIPRPEALTIPIARRVLELMGEDHREDVPDGK